SIHRLIVITNFALALFGAAGAAALGIYYGGIGAGILVGGLFAVVPVFLQLSEMSRPYSMAWSFGMLSLCCAAICASRWRVWLAGAFLGLAIASRIEMLCLLPLVWWIVCERRENSRRIVALVNVMLVSLAVAILVAPWLLTHLIGNLRTIATVRLLGPPGGKAPWASALWEIVFRQGMGIAMVLALAGLVLQPAGARRRAWLLTIYAALLLGSLLVGDSFGVHQHGEVFIALFLLISVTFGAAGTKWNRASPWIVAVALMLPFAQAVRLIRSVRAATVEHEDVPRWIEQHVPAGTTVYLMPGGMRSLLPTTQASDALWKEVTDEQAWRAKMASGLSRFHLSAGDLPRALADENLVQERGNRRQWFILGSRTDLPDPRYDIRVVRGSPVFGIRDPAVAMKQSGGVLVFRDGNDLPRPEEFGPPLVSWLNRDGGGVLIYCTPDLREKIKSDP
ncbi:MAG TPA: hypothetical protein VLI90_18540, partial [Tepidisphaeraceae bacterium]|nr:hypothetical protein [Tepidisphaeraceae bacterium]